MQHEEDDNAFTLFQGWLVTNKTKNMCLMHGITMKQWAEHRMNERFPNLKRYDDVCPKDGNEDKENTNNENQNQ